ncbi:hypothetical protein [Pseudooceanicola sp.]|uniref:hypothetical protein n=1 Tax=Pseudooceanicola sp. TaxID=1914328 RepID=UPI0035172371
MNDSEARLDELQRRLTAALDRIGLGIDGLAAAGPEASGADPDRIAALEQALDEERLANAQLQERIATLKARQDEAAAGADEAAAGQKAAMAQLDRDLQRMRMANEQLRESNRALRAANAEGIGDATLVNDGLAAELEALRAAHAADRSEAEAIVAALAPMVRNQAGAPAEGDI